VRWVHPWLRHRLPDNVVAGEEDPSCVDFAVPEDLCSTVQNPNHGSASGPRFRAAGPVPHAMLPWGYGFVFGGGVAGLPHEPNPKPSDGVRVSPLAVAYRPLQAAHSFEPLPLPQVRSFEPVPIQAVRSFEPVPLQAVRSFEAIPLQAARSFEPIPAQPVLIVNVH